MRPEKITEASTGQTSAGWIGKLPIIASVLALIDALCVVTVFTGLWLGGFSAFLLIILSPLNFLFIVFGFLAIASQFITRKKDTKKILIELAVFLFATLVIWVTLFSAGF